ncbi:metallophosphoesterase family protein [Mangrovibacterium diazotrophicum]|uniref:Calcineurin-like phosphoesterase family protein n=1 Tax=Mangrovibacterium diazotrophicum TaxID=1261403 RepID=A0A419W4J6_9BACT|nr:metallophosphoesterase family protein [Mangrovibacterium diazotrophicum]RKD90362.1 calcineurin-like phosphoesterase family protein [Mangrovibacterium diazotrophicum]
MKRLVGVVLFAFFIVVSVNGQEKQTLKFNNNRELKILQFTDTHTNIEKNKRVEVFEYIRKIVELEKPDLVVLTGDIATDGNPARTYDAFEKLFEEENLPWALVLGNHDSQADWNRQQVATYVQGLKNCLNADRADTDGGSNFVLPVYSSDNEKEALLYFMDSQAYSTLEPLVGGWGWFSHNQVEWYRAQSAQFTAQNNGKPFPALAFFHIPLPEYYAAWTNKDAKAVGRRIESECGPEINTGMFAAMVESGDVMGTFVGHDHYNDYIGVQYNIALAYGRVTKPREKRKQPIPGGRMIVLKEGQRAFDTWIRDVNGKKVYECKYPASFVSVRE